MNPNEMSRTNGSKYDNHKASLQLRTILVYTCYIPALLWTGTPSFQGILIRMINLDDPLIIMAVITTQLLWCNLINMF